ncbi:MAG: hypothetical protein J6O49_02190, partial [Bacteroidaceae bacterium]|nr:hypothetical protein [Bacteroidaceae bacterium]
TAAFNPFMFAWMGALNEADLISGDSISSDLNNNGSVSMSEAYQYARNYWDDEPNGMCSRLSASEENLPSLLSFDIVPHPAKLLIRRFEADTLGNLGTEPVVTWNSPDIWMRNNSDGVANPEQDNIRVSNGDNSKYIYVRIKNTGGLPYSAGNKYLHVLVEQCNLTSSRNSFIWPATDIHENLQPIRLSQTIAPDSAIIVEIPVPLTTAMYDLAGEYNGMLPLNVYAKIDRLQNEELESYMPMSKKSLTRFTPIMGEYLHLPSTNQLFQKYVFRTQLPIYLEDLTGSLCWSAEDLTGSRMLVYGDSYIQFSENMDSVGLQLQQMVNQGDNMFCLTALPASLYDVSQYYGDNMVFRYDYSGRMPINDTSETHHIMIRDQQGNVLDGTSIQLDFIGQPSPGEEPIIQMAENNDGSAQLEALNTHSGSSHEWYSDGGELKGESQSISLTQNELHGNMLLRVVDQETSSVQLASINLDKANQISSVQYLDGQGFDITLFRPSSSDAVICVTSLLTAEIVARSEISQGTSSIMLPSTSISAGLYAVTLIVDNAIADTVQLVIK